MPNEVAIAIAPPITASSTPATGAESASDGNDFVAALANVLSAEATATAPSMLPPLVEEELSDLEDLVEASAGVDPQAMMLTLEQARVDVPIQPVTDGAMRSLNSSPDRAILAAMSLGAVLSVDEQSAGDNPLLESMRVTDALRETKIELKPGSENSVNILAANAAAHERIAELGEKPVIRAHVGSASWTEQLAGKLTLMVGRGLQSASIQLSPENLGPLEIRISVQNEQASVWFGAAHAETRAALEQALPRLRELLAGQGLNLSDAGVFRETPRQPQKTYVPATGSSIEGEREFNVAIGNRGMVDAYA